MLGSGGFPSLQVARSSVALDTVPVISGKGVDLDPSTHWLLGSAPSQPLLWCRRFRNIKCSVFVLCTGHVVVHAVGSVGSIPDTSAQEDKALLSCKSCCEGETSQQAPSAALGPDSDRSYGEGQTR